MSENKHSSEQQIEYLKRKITILEHVMASTEVHFTVHDREGRFLYVNPAGLAAQNMRLEDVEGKNWRDLGFPEEVGIPFDQQVEKIFNEEVILRDETEFPTKDGIRIFENILQPAYNDKGEVVAIVATRHDITEIRMMEKNLRETNAKLEKLATTDYLTELNNRGHFFELSEKELSRAKRYQQPFSLLVIDLDEFKEINDEYGHLYGDRVLQIAADSILEASREVDIAGRYGGDEFALLAPETTFEKSKLLAERICATFDARQKQSDNIKSSSTLSIGISSYENEPELTSIDAIFERADQALYAAKQVSGNSIEIWNKDS